MAARYSGRVTCRHRWIGSFRYGRDGCVSYSFGGIVVHWMDGSYEEAINYLGPTRESIGTVSA